VNIQNQQNGIVPPCPPVSTTNIPPGLTASTKNRQHPAPDSENSDPAGFKPSTKRKRPSDDEEELSKQTTSPSPAKKTNRTVLTPTTGPALPLRPIYSTLNPLPAVSTPKSAPAPARKPAGRSPPPPPSLQPKSRKPFARRSTITKNRGETANSSKKRVQRPFSLATVLGDGMAAAAGKCKPQLQPQAQAQPQTQRKPASWFFDIHVDTKDDEMTNLMQHSTCVLDISDDEDGKVDSEGRGKENIPPAELGGSSIPLTSSRGGEVRKLVGMEDERAPLGELDVAEFYGAGLNAFSCAVVHDGDDAASHSKGKGRRDDEESSLRHTGSGLQDSYSIAALLDATAPAKPADEKQGPGPAEAEFVIWESGSPAGDV
jgi:hypothetical protein